LTNFYGPLPAHPPPRPKETIGSWIVRLAHANKTSFKLMFSHIIDISKKYGFISALSEISSISIQQLIKMHNDFKPEFWKNLLQCPIKKCDYDIKTLNYGAYFWHLKKQHKLGLEWIHCLGCPNSTSEKPNLVITLNLKLYYRNGKRILRRYEEFDLFNCPHCSYNTASEKDFKSHLKLYHYY